MPGPNSQPWAINRYGVRVEGKTALKRAGLRSGDGTSRKPLSPAAEAK